MGVAKQKKRNVKKEIQQEIKKITKKRNIQNDIIKSTIKKGTIKRDIQKKTSNLGFFFRKVLYNENPRNFQKQSSILCCFSIFRS